MHACMHACMHGIACMYACNACMRGMHAMHACMHGMHAMCMHACTQCMHACMHVGRQAIPKAELMSEPLSTIPDTSQGTKYIRKHSFVLVLYENWLDFA